MGLVVFECLKKGIAQLSGMEEDASVAGRLMARVF